MDDVNAVVRKEVVERLVRPNDAQRVRPLSSALGRAAQDATNLYADAAQRLDVDGADEAGPDDGGADARDSRRSQRPLLRLGIDLDRLDDSRTVRRGDGRVKAASRSNQNRSLPGPNRTLICQEQKSDVRVTRLV
jgi:hypothetical protein